MTKIWNIHVALAVAGALTLIGCGTTDKSASSQERFQVVSTFSVLSDIVEEIGGDQVAVHNIVPAGNDPHEYEPTPSDIKALSEASAYFYNGLNLEGGEHGWATQLVESVGFDKESVFEAAQGVEPQYLTDEESSHNINPHAFLDPNVGMIMAENVAERLKEADPDNAHTYQKNLEGYLAELRNIDQKYQEKIGGLDEERRILVTSERAYQYMADRYGLTEGYIWAVDTDEIGTPEQTISAIDFVKKHQPPALFVESNVNPGPMEIVYEETGVEIYATIFSDELAPEGMPGDTYLSLLEENLNDISEGLAQ